MTHTIRGDLVALAQQGMFDVIIHGCNCQKVMGAGIAKTIAQTWPEVRQADQTATPVLGKFSCATVRTAAGLPLRVYNLYTQPVPGRTFNVTALVYALIALKDSLTRAGMRGCRIGYPAIGCGIGGGNWAEVGPLIAEFLGRYFTLIHVEFVPTQETHEYSGSGYAGRAAVASADTQSAVATAFAAK